MNIISTFSFSSVLEQFIVSVGNISLVHVKRFSYLQKIKALLSASTFLSPPQKYRTLHMPPELPCHSCMNYLDICRIELTIIFKYFDMRSKLLFYLSSQQSKHFSKAQISQTRELQRPVERLCRDIQGRERCPFQLRSDLKACLDWEYHLF